MNSTDDSGYARLEDQIKWYNNKSTLAQSNYKISKVFVIIASALIPVLALQEAPNFKLYVAVLGAAIVVAVVVIVGRRVDFRLYRHHDR